MSNTPMTDVLADRYGDVDPDSPYWEALKLATEIESQLTKTRDLWLEEAAKVCEETENEEASGGSMNRYYAQLGDATATRHKCAEEIRALKTKAAA